jgi:CRP/FNR family transcriptional regulator
MKETRFIHCLSQIEFFSTLNDEDRADLARLATYHTFAPDEIIFLENEPTAGLWIMDSGTVKVTKFHPEGDEYILHLVSDGDSFNVVSSLDGRPNPATAIAMSPVTCWRVPSAAIRQLLQTRPQLALACVDMLTLRLRALNHQLEDLALYSVTARLARFLIAQAENARPGGAGVTRAAIAKHLATTSETVSRVLAKLQETGAIRFDRHRIVITNADELRAIALL